MNTPKLTPAQVALLRAVEAGQVSRLGGGAYYGTVGGRHQKLTDRVRILDSLGLINPYGVAIKHGKPMPPTKRFADRFVVTLTPAGEQALMSAKADTEEGRCSTCADRSDNNQGIITNGAEGDQ